MTPFVVTGVIKTTTRRCVVVAVPGFDAEGDLGVNILDVQLPRSSLPGFFVAPLKLIRVNHTINVVMLSLSLVSLSLVSKYMAMFRFT